MLVNMAKAAQELRDAYQGDQIEPLGGRLLPNDPIVGYRVQAINTAHWITEGRRPVGRKIGLTSAPAQALLGLAEPDHGMLFADMRVDDGDSFSERYAHQPRAEAEIAFGIGAELNGSEADEATIVAAIDWMSPAIEIVGSRIIDWRVGAADTIADNASSGLFVLGNERRPFNASEITALSAEIREDGEPVSRGSPTACLYPPLAALVWLARTLAQGDYPLRVGDIVLSGALGSPVPMRAGHRYSVAMSGWHEISVRCED